MTKWLIKYPYKSRSLLFLLCLSIGLVLQPDASGVITSQWFYIRMLLSNGFAASAGYLVTYVAYVWLDDRKMLKKVPKRKDNQI